MKALSIKQPWAYLIAMGDKTIETRTWKTKYRGRILICAGQKPAFPIDGDEQMHLRTLLGMAMCTVDLVDVRPYTKDDTLQSCCDHYEDAYAWILENPKVFTPFPMKGQLGLFEADYEEENG